MPQPAVVHSLITLKMRMLDPNIKASKAFLPSFRQTKKALCEGWAAKEGVRPAESSIAQEV